MLTTSACASLSPASRSQRCSAASQPLHPGRRPSAEERRIQETIPTTAEGQDQGQVEGSWSWTQEGRPSMPRGELKLNCGGDDDRIGGWNTLLEGHKMASMAYRPDLGPCGARQAGRWWLHPCGETTMTCHAHGPERSERSLVPKLMTALPEEEKVGSSSWCHLWPKVS